MRIGFAFLLSLILSLPALARGGHGGPHAGGHQAEPSAGTVHVNGYYRRDGTYVQPYDRAAPGEGQPEMSNTLAGFSEPSAVLGPNLLDDPHARVVVLHGGSYRQTKGEPEVRGRLVIFSDPQAHLYSLPLSSVDLTATRDANGRINRSQAARRRFMQETGYPNGRPGWVIDHVCPLRCGGADDPSNMQWQTVSAAREKDQVERDCSQYCL
jgi:hypothetical protein